MATDQIRVIVSSDSPSLSYIPMRSYEWLTLSGRDLLFLGLVLPIWHDADAKIWSQPTHSAWIIGLQLFWVLSRQYNIHWHNPFSQWQHSFQKKAVLPLAERVMTVWYDFSKTGHKLWTGGHGTQPYISVLCGIVNGAKMLDSQGCNLWFGDIKPVPNDLWTRHIYVWICAIGS